MELVPTDESGGLMADRQPTLEEMRDNMRIGISAAIRQASGVKDQMEFELLYGKMVRHLYIVLDHVILLASNEPPLN